MFINYKREIYALAHFSLSTASFKCLNAFDVLCAQLTRDLLAIAKFLLFTSRTQKSLLCHVHVEVFFKLNNSS